MLSTHTTDMSKTNQEGRVRQKEETAGELCMDLRTDGLALVENSGSTQEMEMHMQNHM